jgi:hypothetical protein
MHVETEPEATMPKKLTKAEAAAKEHWLALYKVSEAASGKVQAMTAVNADIHYHNIAFQNTEGEEDRDLVYHEAYLPAFAETFPKLLAKRSKQHPS